MPAKIYCLDDAHTQPLKITWSWLWRNLTVAYKGQEIGGFATASQLKQGNTFELPDGRQLSVTLTSRAIEQQLELLLDGQPLPGSSTHPQEQQEQFKQARYVLWFMAAINIVLGLVAEIGQFAVLLDFGMGITTIFIGLLFLGLDWWARTRLAPWALYVAIGLIVLDVVATLVFAANGGAGSSGGGGLVIQAFLAITLVRNAAGLKELRAQQEQALLALEW